MSQKTDPRLGVKAKVVVLPDKERRRKRRVKIVQPVRVRPSEPIFEHFDDVRATLNVSRDGLYFLTELDGYVRGMRLFVTFPYHKGPGAINLEYIGEVVRVDRFPGGTFGVAVHLVVSVNLQGHHRIRYT